MGDNSMLGNTSAGAGTYGNDSLQKVLIVMSPRSRQFSSKVEPTLVCLSMEKQGVSLCEAWSMDSIKMGVFLQEDLNGYSKKGGISRIPSPRQPTQPHPCHGWLVDSHVSATHCCPSLPLPPRLHSEYNKLVICNKDFLHVLKKGWFFKGKFSTFSSKKGYKIRGKVHGKGGIFCTSRLAWAPLLNQTAVPGYEP